MAAEVDWDATDGRNGGAQPTVWEVLMEMERFNGRAKSRGSRSGGLGSGPGKGLRACQPRCGLGLGDAFQLPKEDIAGAVRLFRASEASAVRRMRGGAAPDHHGPLARVKVELTHCLKGRNTDVAEIAQKVMKQLKEEVKKKKRSQAFSH